MNHYFSHFVKSTNKFSIFYLSKSSIYLGVRGGGSFLPSTYFLISGPLFQRLGDSFIRLIPPKVSPKRITGSFELKAILVSLEFFTGLSSAKLLCLSTFKS